MSSERRSAFIQEGTVIKGEIRNGGRIEISGYVEGRINAAEVVVNESGKLYGLIKSDAAQINGDVQGDVFVRNLISIGSTGSVTGNIQYNQLRLDPGGNLSAQLHNVPPSLAGDFSLIVNRGQSVVITPVDILAVDPDDADDRLVYTISNARHGYIVLDDRSGEPVEHFTQADLSAGRVSFRHDGASVPRASFDVLVADASGATSGDPRAVEVAVRAIA